MKIGAVIAIGAAILGAGILGPHAPGSQPANPTPSHTVPAALVATPSPPAAAPSPTGVEAVSEAIVVRPPAGSVIQSHLPAGAGSRFLAASGLTIYYVDQAQEIQSSVIGSKDPPRTLATVSRCQAIGPLAAAGHELVYAVTWPFDPTRGAACGDASVLGWSIRLLDLNTGKAREVATGTRSAGSTDLELSQNHLAITASAYAFDRLTDEADPSQGVDIQVHSIAGSLLWQTHSQAPVASIMLGGNRLAVVTDIPDVPADGGATRVAWLSSAAYPPLTVLAVAATTASLSDDGSYLGWDYPSYQTIAGSTSRPDLGIKLAAPAGPSLAATIYGSSAIQAIDPVVSSTDRGPLIAWLATTPDGSTYPVYDFIADGLPRVLESAQRPAWLAVEGSILMWVTATDGGGASEAFAVDLSHLTYP